MAVTPHKDAYNASRSVFDVHQIEIRALLQSSDQRLRVAASNLRARCLDRLGGRIRVVISAPFGGGASDIARWFAFQAARAKTSRLTFPVAFEQTELDANDVIFGPIHMIDKFLSNRTGARIVGFSNGGLERGLLDLLHYHGFTVLEVPPISQRLGDSVFVAKLIQEESFPPGVVLSGSAFQLIHDYFWPGDLAHLRMTLELAGQMAFVKGKRIIADSDLLAIIEKKESNLGSLSVAAQFGWGVSLRSMDMLNLAYFCGYGRVRKAMERWVLEGARVAFAGDTAAAARGLRMPYTTLVSRLRALGIGEIG